MRGSCIDCKGVNTKGEVQISYGTLTVLHTGGGIDGYSRRILWLEVSILNNKRAFIAKYFVDCVKVAGGTACIACSSQFRYREHLSCWYPAVSA